MGLTQMMAQKPQGLTEIMSKEREQDNDKEKPIEVDILALDPKPKKLKKVDLTKVPPYKSEGDALFESFMENKDGCEKIMEYYKNNLKSLKTLHHYIRDELVFKKGSEI